MKNSLPYFKEIDLSSLEEYYHVETILNADIISIDINFKGKSTDERTYKSIKTFLENISEFSEQNKFLIENDFKENGEAFDYINFHLEELDEDELSRTINIDDANTSKERQLLDKLRLVRVGLYPDGKYETDYFGVFDYSIDIDGEPSNQLLVVKTNAEGELHHITWES
ncbi:DUF2004 domain-containing protein [Rufibacter tibetensis]|uniref:DUF2004 domain-containing protein n=1 Tax=Rufibacter tibetensis TaxID=512763 RepID=A0A0P0CFP3_9BACT|nr:DUF2004 domain-containing protein [Rufibacter tibetensis]ALJ00724.1 hypothetical protein DC20_19255 [Rufibacter tibetensis]